MSRVQQTEPPQISGNGIATAEIRLRNHRVLFKQTEPLLIDPDAQRRQDQQIVLLNGADIGLSPFNSGLNGQTQRTPSRWRI